MEKIDCLSAEELDGVVLSYGEPSFRSRQIYNWLYRNNVSSFDMMTNIPSSLREKMENDYEFTYFEEVKRLTSSDGSIKFLFRLEDREHIESVLLRDGDRISGCISTQVGCKMGCKFCATYAAVGFKRNLSVGEILQQVSALRKSAEELFDEKLLNLVFMGMGEPLDNIDNLKKALTILLDDNAFGFSHRKITVSTSGLIDGIKKFFAMETPVNLAVSINAPNQNMRQEIMPVSNKYPLNDLVNILKTVDIDKRKRITLEYVLLGGINDSLSHAKEFCQLIKGVKAKVNLISFNGSPFSKFKAPIEENVLQFQEYLINNNVTTFIRKKLGQDISGACGQLAAEYEGADS